MARTPGRAQEETWNADKLPNRLWGDAPYLIIAYFCEAQTENVDLSEEHQAHIRADKEECINMLPAGILEDFYKNKVFEHFEAKTE